MHIRCVLIRTANCSDSDKLLKMIQEHRLYQYCTYIHVCMYCMCTPVYQLISIRCGEILSVQKPNFFHRIFPLSISPQFNAITTTNILLHLRTMGSQISSALATSRRSKKTRERRYDDHDTHKR